MAGQEAARIGPYTVSDIERAASVLAPYFPHTPIIYSQEISRLTGTRCYLKLDNLQVTGAFKCRGALFKLLEMSEEERKRGVIASSAGNHAQGVAYGAKQLGIEAKIVMPESTPLIKIESTRRYGATVVLAGETYDDAYDVAKKLAEKEDKEFVHPYDDPAVIVGQGVAGYEIATHDHAHEFDAVIGPIGGGGYMSGVGMYLKHCYDTIKLYGAETAACASFKQSLQEGYRVECSVVPTLADGIAVKQPGELTFSLLKDIIDKAYDATDNDIANAVLVLLEKEKLLVEGAGGVSVAVLLKHAEAFKGQTVLCLLSGGNIDVNKLQRIIFRGMSVDGRLRRLRIRLEDVSGALFKLSEFFDNIRTNILDITHHRIDSTASFGQVDVTVTIETKGNEHCEEVQEKLRKLGYYIQVVA